MTWLALALIGYALANALAVRWPSSLTNPTLLTTLLLIAALWGSQTPPEHVQKALDPISQLLGPAVVALAVPLYRSRELLRRSWQALVIGGVSGTCMAAAINTLLAQLLHLPYAATLSTAPATSPVSLELAHYTHAPPALAASMSVIAGLLGAVILPLSLNKLRIASPVARGIAYGSVSHGVGTARARQEGELTGSASSVGMGLAALVMTVLVALASALGLT